MVLDEDKLVKYVKKESRTRPYPTKNEVANEFDVDKDTVLNHATKAKRNDRIEFIGGEGSERRYLFSEYDKDISENIVSQIEKLDDAWLRKPGFEEVANYGQFNPEDKQFKENFYKIKKKKDFIKPNEDEKQKKGTEVRTLLPGALILYFTTVDKIEDVEKGKENRKSFFQAYTIPEEVMIRKDLGKRFKDYKNRNKNLLDNISCERTAQDTFKFTELPKCLNKFFEEEYIEVLIKPPFTSDMNRFDGFIRKKEEFR